MNFPTAFSLGLKVIFLKLVSGDFWREKAPSLFGRYWKLLFTTHYYAMPLQLTVQPLQIVLASPASTIATFLPSCSIKERFHSNFVQMDRISPLWVKKRKTRISTGPTFETQQISAIIRNYVDESISCTYGKAHFFFFGSMKHCCH